MNKELTTVLNTNTNLLKLVAVFSMLIDHIGAVFFPKLLLFRIIGRIAFPLFAYSTFIGFYKTKNLWKYLKRILLVAIISEPIYLLTFSFETLQLNILFSLCFELIILYFLNKKEWLFLIATISLMILSGCEYCGQLLVLIPIFYYAKNNQFIFTLSFFPLLFSYALSENMYGSFPSVVYVFEILALPLILLKTNINLKISKYFFYVFYPIHLLILLIIKSFI